MIRKCMLLGIMLALGLLGWSQNRGAVTVTAIPPAICVGESAQLHVEVETASVIDFETGNFSQFGFQNSGPYPWIVVSAETMDGSTYCMKSGNQGVTSSTSTITATFNFTSSGSIRFDARCMGEGTYTIWDACTFKVDGETLFSYGAQDTEWNHYGYNVAAGIHTFTWIYSKDYSVDPTGDAFFVDNIVFSNQEIDDSSVQGNNYGFENGTLQGWRNLDANGDGHQWKVGSSSNSYYAMSIPGHNSSSHCLYSESYVCTNIWYDYDEYVYHFEGNAVTPNNYLVSPSKITIHNGAYLSFWACGVYQWPAEHFGVAISSANNPTSGSSFTTIQEWTMTAGSNSYEGWPYQGAWRRYMVDLSPYAGQSLWIAIRHFNCTDQFYLAVDDITLYEGSDNPEGYDNITFQWSPGNMTGQNITVSPTQTTTYTVTALDGNGTVIGTAQQTVAVESMPEVSITTNTGETAICEEDTIILYASVNGTDYYLPGDILCTDGSVVHPSDWPCGKTARGVVFYVDDTGLHGWAVDLGQNVPSVQWSKEKLNVPGLTSYSTFMEAITDLDGYTNTQKIRLYGNDAKYPAAWAVDFNHGWYLPAIGQLNILYGVVIVVNASMDRVGGTAIETVDLWSSSANTNEKSWMMRTSNGYVWMDPKSSQKRVRAVTNF